jgi:hypothetical protein
MAALAAPGEGFRKTNPTSTRNTNILPKKPGKVSGYRSKMLDEERFRPGSGHLEITHQRLPTRLFSGHLWTMLGYSGADSSSPPSETK